MWVRLPPGVLMKSIDWQRAETDIAYRKSVNTDLGLMNAILDRRSVEIEVARKVLRQVCATWGDNDWPDNLYLADIIEKHLWRNLENGMAELEDKLDQHTLKKVEKIMINAYNLDEDLDEYPGGDNCTGHGGDNVCLHVKDNLDIDYAYWEQHGYTEPEHKS